MENKINIARFKEGSRTAEVKDIWQWDYGQILRIQGLSLPTAVEIHFSLDEHGGEAVRRIGITKDGVTDVPIPDSMVENESAYGDSYYFFAYIYLTDETSGNTEYKIRAKVSTRSKPEGYISGGNDTFAEILKTVNEIAEDKVDIPAPAKVGQVLSVKATDESGKPTEFEATDQGGGVSDEKIAEAVGTYMEAHPIEETDPTVPGWAKQPEKPRYTASEVGALPDTTKIPSKTSDLQNDSGFLTEHQDLSGYALKSEVPKSASDVGADAAGTAVAKVSEHNTASNAHNDIRLLVQGLTERLNALADSDDTTLDQMSEVVAYIKSNKSLIDAITTSKINVSDIIDNLTTNVSNKPLSAAQGVKLKALIDAIFIPTKLSELENDSGYAKTTDIPDMLPNPQKLTFTGAVTAEYDGSGAVSVEIPSGGGGSDNDTGNFEPILTYVATSEDVNLTRITFESSEYPKIGEIKNRVIIAIFRETVPSAWHRPYINGVSPDGANFNNKYSYSLIYRIGNYLYGSNCSCDNYNLVSELKHEINVTGNTESLFATKAKIQLPYTSIGVGSYTTGWLHEGDKIVIMGEV